MAARQRGLPGLGLAARNAMALAELAQRAARLGIQDASAADDQRPARRAEHLRGPRELLAGRRRAPWCPYPLLEETLRPRVRFGLHVLAQGERRGRRTALRRARPRCRARISPRLRRTASGARLPPRPTAPPSRGPAPAPR